MRYEPSVIALSFLSDKWKLVGKFPTIKIQVGQLQVGCQFSQKVGKRLINFVSLKVVPFEECQYTQQEGLVPLIYGRSQRPWVVHRGYGSVAHQSSTRHVS